MCENLLLISVAANSYKKIIEYVSLKFMHISVSNFSEVEAKIQKLKFMKKVIKTVL